MSQSHTITALSDLAPIDIIVEIDRPGGEIIAVPLRTLTYSDWLRLGLEIPNPTPPISGVDKSGQPIFDTRNLDYLRQLEDANIKRGLRRLLAALQIDVPGDTVGDQLAALEATLDSGVGRQLLGVLAQIAAKGEARIAHRAGTFQPAGADDWPDLPTARLDSEPMVESD
jgi:hypothetical protein